MPAFLLVLNELIKLGTLILGQKLDYRRYGVNLIEILIAGGLLAPGGIVHQEGENVCQTKICLFGLADSMEKIRAFEQVTLKHCKKHQIFIFISKFDIFQVFIKLMRRYKYLEKMHEEEMNKILVYLKGFSEDERNRLAQVKVISFFA